MSLCIYKCTKIKKSFDICYARAFWFAICLKKIYCVRWKFLVRLVKVKNEYVKEVGMQYISNIYMHVRVEKKQLGKYIKFF